MQPIILNSTKPPYYLQSCLNENSRSYVNLRKSGPICKKNVFLPSCLWKTDRIVIINKVLRFRPKLRKYYKIICRFFKKAPFNSTTGRKSRKFLPYLLLLFLITHNLNLFLQNLTKFLQNTPRRFQLKIIRLFVLLNQQQYRSLFRVFGVSGLYFRVSGKFSGIGGSKKMRKKVVWFKPCIADKSICVQRSVHVVWGFSGTTTWSVYASFL